jgi:hypothetical protein
MGDALLLFTSTILPTILSTTFSTTVKVTGLSKANQKPCLPDCRRSELNQSLRGGLQ